MIVISGYACRLPESPDATQFWQNLITGRDMVTEDARRWAPGIHGTPRRFAKLDGLERFDARYFEIHAKQAHKMDPRLRLLLEVSHEAIMGAGVAPHTLRGSNTAVYVGACSSDAYRLYGAQPEQMTGYENTGCLESMMANRLSYSFDFHGNSQTIDTACSSSLVALDAAVRALQAGECEHALVGGVNLLLQPALTVGFNRLKMLSPDGRCRSFDHEANGYVRAEGIVALFLTRRSCARRVIASVLGTGVNSDGYTEQGITFPNSQAQRNLITAVCERAGVNPGDVAYVEAHGTGTAAGDPQEANVLCDAFCGEGTQRSAPLLLGSVKSNMGHAEGAAGLAGVLKVLLAMEHKRLPPNLHFNAPNPDIPGLLDGRMQVVTDARDWTGGIAAVNSFGFGGTNAHVLLRDEVHITTATEPPPVIPLASRTAAGLDAMLRHAASADCSADAAALITAVASLPTKTHPYRAALLRTTEGWRELRREVAHNSAGVRPPVWFAFPGMGQQWPGMGRALLQRPVFRQAVERCAAALQGVGLDLQALIQSGSPSVLDDPLPAFVALVTIQIGLVDLLRSLGVQADGFIGHSVGEIACGYADGALSAEQAVRSAYWRGHHLNINPGTRGKMAAVRLDWAATQAACPPGVVPACHNAANSVTVSGQADAVEAWVAQLTAQGVDAREVRSAHTAFHSPQMRDAAPGLLAALREVIPNPQPRSARWLSTSQADPQAPSTCSAQYLVDNLCNPVRFFEAAQQVPAGALVIEIGAHPLLRLPITETVQDAEHVALMRRDHDHCDDLFDGLARCHLNGLDLDWPALLAPAYPLTSPCEVPALCAWEHDQAWDVPKPDLGDSHSGYATYRIDLDDEDCAYLADHQIGEQVIFPATGYIDLVWRTVAGFVGVPREQCPVRFNDVRFHRPTLLAHGKAAELAVRYLPDCRCFEIGCEGELVVSGSVAAGQGIALPSELETAARDDLSVPGHCFYKELKTKIGFHFGPAFRSIQQMTADRAWTRVAWAGNWATFLDGLLQSNIVQVPQEALVPVVIRELTIDPLRQATVASVLVHHDGVRSRTSAVSVVIDSVRFASFPATKSTNGAKLTQRRFIPHIESDCRDFDQANLFESCVRYATHVTGRSALEVLDKSVASHHPLPPHLHKLKAALANAVQSSPEPVRATAPNALFDGLIRHAYAHPDQLLADPLSAILGFADHHRFYSDDIAFSALFNDRYLGVLLDMVYENAPLERSLHWCEIGTGTGGLATHVLPRLRLNQDRYTLTDVSAGFFPALRERFEPFGPAIDCHAWDVNQPQPAAIAGPLDVVLASNALHAVRNLRAALAHVHAALSDGGFLLLHEVTHGWPNVLGIWGFLDQLWQFDDPEDRSHGALVSRERWERLLDECGFDVVSVKDDGVFATLFLCRKRGSARSGQTLRLRSPIGEAIAPMQAGIESLADPHARLWLQAREAELPGLPGLVNCLRAEPGGEPVRCILADAPTDAELDRCRRFDLVMNIQRDGQWGSFRPVPLPEAAPVATPHARLVQGSRGDLSTLRWQQAAPLRSVRYVPYYAGVNFNPVLIATGRLPEHVFGRGLDGAVGGEFSGTTPDGRRVMGFLDGPFATLFDDSRRGCVFDLPEGWSLEDAATVPLAYLTAFLGLVLRGRLRRGERVLIHAGSGGVGQAAIRIAHALGCEVFTTVGSPHKRAYLKTTFPFLDENHIGHSRDISFEALVMAATGERGVDVVLNSLSEAQFEASLRTLAPHGRFVEIGKYDMVRNASLGMEIFLRDISFCAVSVDQVARDGGPESEELAALMRQGLTDGTVQPLDRTVFEYDQVSEAFRTMARGQHVGKLLLRLRDEPQAALTEPVPVSAEAAVACDPAKSYLITGGLGGMGLELADWLVRRGARDLVLVSRRGVTDPYQTYRIEGWRRAGAEVQVAVADVADAAAVHRMIREAQQRRPIGGVFHLAMELNDALFVNQTRQSFEATCRAKAEGAAHLDAATREHCKALDHFVVFSSLVSSWGNGGQTNYGYANSAMEYLCEQRRQASLPGLAIEWGAVGDVGFVQDNPDQVGGGLVRRQTRDQSIASCIQALEKFMLAGGPVGCSYVPNDAIAASGNAAAPAEPADLPSIVKGILGLGAQQLVDEQLSLAEFGLDSLMAVEVQMQLKKRGIAMTLPAVRELSFARLASLVPAAVATPAKTPEAPLCQPLREGSDPTRVLYAVNGLMLAPRYLESVALPGDEAAYAVLYQNVAGVEALHDAWLAHLERLPAAVQTVRLFGYSIGALLAQRFAAFARERTGRRLEIVSVAPPLRDRLTPNYYGIELAGRTMVEALDALPRQELVALLQRFALYELKHDFMLLPLDDIKRQLKLVFERDPYEDPLATADVLALPQDDEHCLREEDARSLTRHLIRLDGRHDLRTLQLVEVFGCLA